jgi:hypothetical protein
VYTCLCLCVCVCVCVCVCDESESMSAGDVMTKASCVPSTLSCSSSPPHTIMLLSTPYPARWIFHTLYHSLATVTWNHRFEFVSTMFQGRTSKQFLQDNEKKLILSFHGAKKKGKGEISKGKSTCAQSACCCCPLIVSVLSLSRCVCLSLSLRIFSLCISPSLPLYVCVCVFVYFVCV